jgi:hypothetical protein
MRRRRWALAFLAIAGVAVLGLHNVDTGISPEDETFARRILAEAGYPSERESFGEAGSFGVEIKTIQAVQDAVLRLAGLDKEIPFDRGRELKDIYELKHGLCFDRSRAIEQILTYLAFDVRHVAVYSTARSGALRSVFTPGNRSHALSEVKTAKGWMAVDPNVRWIGLSAAGEPLTVADLRTIDAKTAKWAPEVTQPPHAIFFRPYVYIRGLYSRHGRFYPPYSPIPDVNWGQLAQNFGS